MNEKKKENDIKSNEVDKRKENKKSIENKKILILIISLILIDQIVKIILISTNSSMLEWSIASEDNTAYILISLIAILLLLKYVTSNNTFIKFRNKVVLSFAIAGVVGNVIDRIWKGHVITYIYIPNFISINLSYIYLIITWLGLALMLTKYTMERINEKKNNGKK